MNKENVFLVILLLGISLYSDPISTIVNYTNMTPEQDIQSLIKDIDSYKNSENKLKSIKSFSDHHFNGITGNQLSQILLKIEYEEDKEQAIYFLKKFIYEITSAELNTILESIKTERYKLKVLSELIDICSGNSFDDIYKMFKTQKSKNKASSIVENRKPFNPIFGNVEGKNILFIIDTSSSMNSQFTFEDKQITRLNFVIQKINDLLDNTLSSKNKVNFITYNSTSNIYHPDMVLATEQHKISIRNFLKRVKANGGTNLENALREVRKFKDVDTIYILSDGIDYKTEVSSDIIGSFNGKIHTVAFLPGIDESEETRSYAKKFLFNLAKKFKGTFRVIE